MGAMKYIEAGLYTMRLKCVTALRWLRRFPWLSHPVYDFVCERCHMVKRMRETDLSADHQMWCQACEMKTFHKRCYYDHELREWRELDL
jgi:hypothetical protein